ncbi:LOG family protein [Asticcacaulis endophyticus]|uniref:Cytokinin riboside 5'-monophosphate phosphoribohydrolase n=1 Tax=Asticcacaulis endophyticus TaxID=1395890 RepID=A0A918UUP7_9CAUL|nr:TIGR00730 family Rossman fold protein [Asticcacaulis endophyticus]GGZ36864.1 cytokinin riboside 5'-monophosphate phosphoribohydrolase [Asticcacaulis endophyticus]
MTHQNIKTICLYCGSSNGKDPAYVQAAQEFGALLAQTGLKLVYGGGDVGLMGAAARAAYDAGGKVKGIMPRFLRTRERLFDEVETVVVDSMHERKMLMFEDSDAFVVFPGGVGTLEEVIELLSWRRLDLHKKPIIFFNQNCYWNPFFDMISYTIGQGFTPEAFKRTYMSVDKVSDILKAVSHMSTQDEDIDTRKVM